jgi:hypothetical protein
MMKMLTVLNMNNYLKSGVNVGENALSPVVLTAY